MTSVTFKIIILFVCIVVNYILMATVQWKRLTEAVLSRMNALINCNFSFMHTLSTYMLFIRMLIACMFYTIMVSCDWMVFVRNTFSLCFEIILCYLVWISKMRLREIINSCDNQTDVCTHVSVEWRGRSIGFWLVLSKFWKDILLVSIW